MIQIAPVIICGGSGSRLWPLSRGGFPKQYLCLTGNKSLLQQAALRLNSITGSELDISPLYIVGNEEHRFLASEQLRECGVRLGGAVLEPMGKNTAPAVTLAALAATESGHDPVLVIVPADQTIADESIFCEAMRVAAYQADQGHIVVLGVVPDRPETGYGYIQASRLDSDNYLVERFVEKPDIETARKYISNGSYFWNAGIFVVRASVWLEAISHFRSDIFRATEQAWQQRSIDAEFIRPGRAEFESIPAESVDYAVLENCSGSKFTMRMVSLDAGWSDLGAWDAVWDAQDKDSHGNSHLGDVLSLESRNTLVHAGSRLVALVGVQDLVVVDTPDAVLVVAKNRSQDVKKIVSALELAGREERTLHRKVHRPWGWYDSVDEGTRFKVKRILVRPKASLSLQMHHHRAEHWVVVSGTAEITNGDQKILLTENQSTYIPLGKIHRLANPGEIPLEIIEVQSGGYLGEDDIVRFEDNYGRTSS